MDFSNITAVEAAAMKSLIEQRRLAINLFRPLLHQEEIFIQPRPKYVLACGGNRSGKTVCLLALVAAFAMEQQITFLDGSKRDARMPWQKGKPMEIWLMCIDSDHIGRVLYNGLFRAGHFPRFRTVYDKQTRLLRLHDHNTDPEDISKPHPPLIPSSYIGDFAWEDKAKNVFKSVTIKNPRTGQIMATIRAFTSKGDAPQGSPVDLILVEEQLARNGYIGELQARLVDKRGQLIWSSWNADSSDDEDDLSAFNAMIDRENEAGSGIAKRVTLTMSGNTTFTREMISEALSGYTTEEERLQRDLGIRPSEKLRMYPLFNKTFHSVYGFGDKLEETLKARDGIPPNDWTKTLILDPGTSNPAVLLCAVPPPEYGNYLVPYQEFYPGRADPWQLAELVSKQVKGEVFYRFYMDNRAGRQQTMGMRSDARVKSQYEQAFAEFGISCITTKSMFLPASDDVGGRQLVLQGWMHELPSGAPKLRIVTNRCPELCSQLLKVKKHTVSKEVRDDRKVPGTPHDVSDCLEYWAASGPRYIFVPKPKAEGNEAYQRYMKRFGSDSEKKPIQIGTHY